MEEKFKESPNQPRHAVFKFGVGDTEVAMKVIVTFDGAFAKAIKSDQDEESLRDELAYDVFVAVKALVSPESEIEEGSGGEAA